MTITLSEEEGKKLHFLMNGPEDPALQMAYVSVLKQMDRENARLYEARLEGKNEGKIEGKIEGELEGMIKVARNLKKMGTALETIVAATGLSLNEIQKL